MKLALPTMGGLATALIRQSKSLTLCALMALAFAPTLVGQSITQPVSQEGTTTYCAGFVMTLKCSATGGTAPYTFKWFRGAVELTSGGFTSVSSTGSDTTLQITLVTSTDAGTYTCEVTDAASGVSTSAGLAIAVETPAQVLTQPVSQVGCIGGASTLAIVAGGDPAPTFQWQSSTTGMSGSWGTLSNSAIYSGVTTDSLTVSGISAAELQFYRVVVMNTCGGNSISAISNAAELTADVANPTFSGFPADMPGVTVDAGTCGALVSWTEPAVTDNCGTGTLLSVVTAPAVAGVAVGNPSGTFDVGTTMVTYVGADSGGNTVTNSFTITVTDNEPPVISDCPTETIFVSAAAPILVSSTSIIVPSFADNCGINAANSNCMITDSVGTSTFDGTSMLQMGRSTVSCTAEDLNGNTASCTFDIFVCDPTPLPTVYVDASWSVIDLGDDPDAAGPREALGCDAFATIKSALAAVADGGTIMVAPGTYVEDGQILVNKSVTLSGTDAATTIVKTNADTGSSGDARGWFLVEATHSLDINDLTFDGDGQLVHQAFRQKGAGSFTDCVFIHIKFNESGPHYQGVAVAAFGDGPVNFTRCDMSEIGRIGILYFGAGVNGSVCEELTYTGKGMGDWLDYMLDISGGANVTVLNSSATACQGIASVDGSTSAGVLVSTFFAPGTTATLTGNTLSGNSTGLFVGFDAADTSTVIASSNDLSDNDNWGLALSSNLSSTDCSGNWWGSNDPAMVAAQVVEPTPTLPDVLVGDFTPWLASDTDTDVAAGFQGDFDHLHVGVEGGQTGTTGRIQEGVNKVTNLVAANALVDVHAGTYNEGETRIIRNDIVVRGANYYNVPACDGSGLNPLRLPAEETVVDTMVDLGAGVVPSVGFFLEGNNIQVAGFKVTNCYVGFSHQFHSSSSVGNVAYEDSQVLNNIVTDIQANPNPWTPTSSSRGVNFAFASGSAGVTVIQGNLIDHTGNMTVPMSGIVVGRDTTSGPGVQAADADISDNCILNAGGGIWGHMSGALIANNYIGGYIQVQASPFPFAGGIFGTLDNTVISGNTIADYDGAQHPLLLRGAKAFFGISVAADIANPLMLPFNNTVVTGNTLTNNFIGVLVGIPSAATTNVLVEKNTVSGSDVGVSVLGLATIKDHSGVDGSLAGNHTGILVSTILPPAFGPLTVPGTALVENNDLSNCTLHGIQGVGAAIIDAGDCADGNITGLGTGSATGGSSAGSNLLTGYGFNSMVPLAVDNSLSTGTILAGNNDFGAGAGDVIASALSGAVTYSQSGGTLFASCSATLSGECAAPAPATDLASFMALAGGSVTSSNSGVTVSAADVVDIAGFCGGQVTRTYTIADNCGNTGTCVQVITVDDTTAPTGTAPASVAVDCSADLSTTALGDVTAGDVNDNCSANTALTIGAPTDAITAGACAGTYVIMRTWTVSDECGNSVDLTQMITVTDTTAPVLDFGAPSNQMITVECDQPTDTGSIAGPTATDDCGTATVMMVSEVTTAGTCPSEMTITRVWEAADDCGNTSAQETQVITVVDTTAPVFDDFSGFMSVTIECSDSTDPSMNALLGTPTATDNCSAVGDITITSSDSFDNTGACGSGTTITRTWTATDECSQSVDLIQTITVVDTTPPVLTGICPTVADIELPTGECDVVVNWTAPTFTDNCGSLVLSNNFDPGLRYSPGTYNVVYTADDGCTTPTTCEFSFTVRGDWKPVSTPYAVGNDPRGMDTGDLGLGDPMIATPFAPLGLTAIVTANANGVNDGSVTILFNDGAGGYADANRPSVELSSGYFVAGDSPVDVVIGNFFPGGGNDLAVLVQGAASDCVVLIENDGTQFVSPPTVIDLGTVNGAPVSIAAGDINGSGADEIIACLQGDAFSVGSGAYLITDGAGPAVNLTSGVLPSAAEICDLDNDTLTDAAILTQNSGILLFQGTGATVTPAGSIGVPSGTGLDMCCTDLDADQQRDDLVVLTTSLTTGSVHYFLNQGTGFGAGQFAVSTDTKPAGNLPAALACGDIRSDSIPGGLVGDPAALCLRDVVVANFGGNTSGTPGQETISQFVEIECDAMMPSIVEATSRTACFFGASPVDVALAEVSGDGLDDLIVLNRGDSTVQVLCSSVRALADSIGEPCQGVLGVGPNIGVTSLPAVGGSFRVTLTGAIPAAGATLAASPVGGLSIFGPCQVYLGFPVIVLTPSTFTDISGYAEWPPMPAPEISIPVGFAGSELFFQWVVSDPAGFSGTTLSDGLRIRVGQ